jgi:hypothetical protein
VFLVHLHVVTKLLKLRPYERTVVHAFKEHDPFARINFCNWFLQSVHDEGEPHLVFFSDKACFPYVEK